MDTTTQTVGETTIIERPPYTPQQVIHNLQNMLEQLRNYPPNLEGGPGWCRKQAENIIARGIEGDKLHPKTTP